MQLKKWLAVALVAAMLNMAQTTITLATTAAGVITAATIGLPGLATLTIANPALAAVGAGAVLLGAAGLIGGIHIANRGKREVIGVPADDGFSANAVDILFATAASIDRETNCGLRLVCELAATPENELAADEALIMSLFGDQVPLSHDMINAASTPFQLAAFLGRQSQSAATCANTYLKCQYNSHQTMEILRQNGNGQLL